MAEYIEREALLKKMHGLHSVPSFLGHQTDEDILFQIMVDVVREQPTADVVPAIRCKDCVYCVDLGTSGLYCDHDDNRNPLGCRPNDYCNDGERRCEE